MLRSRTHKLIYGHNRKQRLFFDLEKDPYELDNLYDSPQYREEVQSFILKLSDVMLFEALPPSYLDVGAPSVLSEEDRTQADARHQAAEQWFRSRMNEVLP
jgi:hypothetical protein